MHRELVLASTSAYRRGLLARLRLPFRTVAPRVDESPLPGEAAGDLACRLAEAKARDVAAACPDAVVIGSDQVALGPAGAIGKPGGFEAAAAQLRAVSGRRIRFLTALCVLDARSGHGPVDLVETEVRFRALDDAWIRHYLEAERPYDCSGSFRAEALGIVLLESVQSHDPTALIGLPLIALTSRLIELGWPAQAFGSAAHEPTD